MSTSATRSLDLYWHRDLPPLSAEAIGEHTLEPPAGASCTVLHADEEWNRSYKTS